MTEPNKVNFIDAIKNAQKMKTTLSNGKATQVQQAKTKNQVSSNRPTKRSTGRGG